MKHAASLHDMLFMAIILSPSSKTIEWNKLNKTGKTYIDARKKMWSFKSPQFNTRPHIYWHYKAMFYLITKR